VIVFMIFGQLKFCRPSVYFMSQELKHNKTNLLAT
jgi:hypothetical protein